MTVGERIREVRRSKGITARALVRTLAPGIRTNCGGERVSGWELGKRNLLVSTLPRIAAALGVTLSELLEGVTE